MFSGNKNIIAALQFASGKHSGQYRKGRERTPYINHPIEVAFTLSKAGYEEDDILIIGAILHDTLEDTQTSSRELLEIFGQQVYELVLEVSDDMSLDPDYRKALNVKTINSKSRRAKLLKLADKICNIKDLIDRPPSGWSVERKLDYIKWSRKLVNAIRGTHRVLESEFDREADRAESYLRHGMLTAI